LEVKLGSRWQLSALCQELLLLRLALLLLLLQAGNLALAKQHYRRALQKCPQHFTTRTYLQLGECFMASGDASAAADMYAACLAASCPTPPAADLQRLGGGGGSVEGAAPGCSSSRSTCGGWVGAALQLAGGSAVGGGVVPGRCASTWLALALAYVRLGEVRPAELALSEANICDPQHPAVWGHLALLALQQVGELVRESGSRQAPLLGPACSKCPASVAAL
jgi:tetratricopeptide (TPR) repeat protein